MRAVNELAGLDISSDVKLDKTKGEQVPSPAKNRRGGLGLDNFSPNPIRK
jgi:hypothetical protein